MQPMRPRRIRESAGTGRQARLRGVCQPTWEFKSPLSHQKQRLIRKDGSLFFVGDLNSRAAVNDMPAACQSREVGRRARRLQVFSLAPRRRGLRIVRDDVFFYAENVISHSLRRSSFPNRTRFAGLRFGFLFGDLNFRAAVNDMPGEMRACAASGRKSRLEFSAAVKEPEEMRKPERFFENRKVDCQSREAGRRARRLQVSSLAPKKRLIRKDGSFFCFTLSGSVSGTARGYSPPCPGSSG